LSGSESSAKHNGHRTILLSNYTKKRDAVADLNVVDLVRFRQAFHGAMHGWADALFETADALLEGTKPVSSAPELSLESVFRRSHGSLYKGLRLGGIDEDAMRRLLVAHRPADWPLVFAVDASTWDRCDAECSPERGFYYSASKHSAGQPIVAGWHYQWVSQLNWDPNSWTAPVDSRRLDPMGNETQETIEQVRGVIERLGETSDVPLFVFDAGYDAIAIGHELADVRCQTLTRIGSNRVFYEDAPARRDNVIGRPRRHGKRFSCTDESTQHAPDVEHHAHDNRYGDIRVRAWSGLHPRLVVRGHWSSHEEAPIVRATVIRVDVERLPKPSSRSSKTLWLWWAGKGEPDLDLLWRAYLRRFDIEHTYRFAKNTLGWTTPKIEKPSHADLWTWLIIAAYTQLRLARSLVGDLRMPWERPCDPATLSPRRVRRGFCRVRASIGTPAQPPKTYRPGPGRPKGSKSGPRKRYPAVKKSPSEAVQV
jgi:hypothetical protein